MVSHEVAATMLRHAAPGVVVQDVITRSGGDNSAVYEVRTGEPAGRMIIKVYSELLHWKMHKEIYVYGLLGDLPTPKILYADDSKELIDRNYVVMTVVDGRPLSEVVGQLGDADLYDIYRELGVLLGRIHHSGQEGFGYIGTSVLDPVPTNTEYMTGRFAKKLAEFGALGGDQSVRDAVERHVRERTGLFAACSAAVLCHNDLHEGNVLVAHDEPGWRVSGLVDVENALAADPALDIAKTEYYSTRDNPAKLRGLLDGYGDPPAGWPDILPLYRIYHALELWDWFASIGRTEPLAGLADDLRRFTR